MPSPDPSRKLARDRDLTEEEFKARWPGRDVEAHHTFLLTAYQVARLRERSEDLRAAWVFADNGRPYLAVLVDRRMGEPKMSPAEVETCVLDAFWARHCGDWHPRAVLVKLEHVTGTRDNQRF